MSAATMFVQVFDPVESVWFDDASEAAGAPVTLVLVPADGFCATVNRLIESISGTVAVVSGGRLADGWLAACSDSMDLGCAVVSPWVYAAGKARAWWDCVSPYSFVTDADTLRNVGGLEERVVFGYAHILGHRLHAAGLRSFHDKRALVEPYACEQADAARGALYYRQLDDAEVARRVCV